MHHFRISEFKRRECLVIYIGICDTAIDHIQNCPNCYPNLCDMGQLYFDKFLAAKIQSKLFMGSDDEEN